MEEALYVDEISLKHVCLLGRGSYGSVSLKIHPGYKYYAKKRSLMHQREKLEKELRIMLRFHNHPRIVQASSSRLHLGMLLKDCYIYMEYASEGTLHKVISGFGGQPLPENVIGRSTHMILQGLEALHSHGYVHCDLKPSNILLFPYTTSGAPWDLKLADFGSSKEPFGDSRVAGTKLYMPPEYFRPDGVVGPAFDIWSLGCVVYKMFGGKPIKMGDSYEWRLCQDISPVAVDFLKQCHVLDPLLRASATKLLNHTFITQRFSIPRPIPTPPERHQQQHLNYPFVFRYRVRGPLPTPIGPTRRQQNAAVVVPEAQGSVMEDQSLVENNDNLGYRLSCLITCNARDQGQYRLF